ncbi:hypothetical protein Mspyr1_54800 (plasmid) [Mycolicibacterium gilvum Spyr1]|uniref:Uncharacterized protein n=2 Tax=Mycolicibacterium TaxID=1866885 RepID=A0A0J6YHW0_9MYCO|nr:hypothetical protein Mspyr1_54800 [Mycolicibacterium gilvum Spyr1]KMO72476.1 hypothetical protein MCHLDSM_03959 [Mycolicibacterium chlorophenolicum]
MMEDLTAAQARAYNAWFQTCWGAHRWAVELGAVDDALSDISLISSWWKSGAAPNVRAISRDRPARNGFGLRVDRVVPQRRGRRRPWPPCSHERGHDCRESTSKGTPLLLDGVNHIAWISKNVARLGFYADVFDAEVGPTRPHGENPGETMTVLRIGPTPCSTLWRSRETPNPTGNRLCGAVAASSTSASRPPHRTLSKRFGGDSSTKAPATAPLTTSARCTAYFSATPMDSKARSLFPTSSFRPGCIMARRPRARSGMRDRRCGHRCGRRVGLGRRAVAPRHPNQSRCHPLPFARRARPGAVRVTWH